MSSGEGPDVQPVGSVTGDFVAIAVSAAALPDADTDAAVPSQEEGEGREVFRQEDNQDEETNINPSQVQDAVNIASQMIAISVALITCPIHEHCDGSCSGPPVVLAPIAIGDFPFKVTGDRPKMDLPPEQEHPVEIPTMTLEYSQIDSEAGQIRLIHVHEAVFQSDPIVIDIVTVKFDDPDMPKYAALSYHWGTPVFDHTLICDGKKLQINESLHNCLKRHRQDQLEKPQYLWVDAICINQKDTEELIGQILQMRKIYETAEIVFVDFGNASLQFYFAYDLLYRIKIANNILKDHLRDEVEIRDYISHYGLLPPLDGPEWGIFRQLFTSSWLKRTWTIQEVTLAREIRCRYGRFSFEWKSLISAFVFQANQPQSLNWSLHISVNAHLGLANFYRIVLIGMDYKLGRLKPLDLLWRTRDCEVSNPLDRVIALLGLFPSKYRNFRPDYTISPELLFHRFAVHVLRSYIFSPEQASILSYAGLHRRVLTGHLPSWAPDWMSMSTFGPAVFATIREKPYNCAGETLAMLQSFGDSDEDKERNLVASLSLLVGKITHVTSKCDLDREYETEPQSGEENRRESLPDRQWLKWHEEISALVSELGMEEGKLNYPDVDEALARTLLVDDTYTGENATANGTPILDPKKAHADAVASMAAGDKDVTFTTPAGSFKTQTITASRQRRFAVTDTGYIGLVPSCTEVGDEVHILGGVTVPFVLRATEETLKYTLIGDSYIHGIMDGEFVAGKDGVDDLGKWGGVQLV